MKISNPLWAVWCIIVKSRRGWCELCRLPLSCMLLLSLYWGGEAILIWGWYNSPEVTGDLMRGTWHWNVLCANAILPMQMTVKWRRVQGWKRAAVLRRWLRSRRATEAAMHLDAFILISAWISPCFVEDFPRGSSCFGGAGWRCDWLASPFLLMWSKRKELECYLLSVVMIYLYWTIRHQKEICGQWTLR